MNKEELIKYLGKIVSTPKGNMRLVEIYANGNVGCVPVVCVNYDKELKEFHVTSLAMAGEK